MFLRHCVYSRYASCKSEATTSVWIGQESLGHSIVGLGHAVDDQLDAHRNNGSSGLDDLLVFVGSMNRGIREGLHLKRWKSEFITTN